jgi:predicted  nucleic acid-binding Zn-ribbon protein
MEGNNMKQRLLLLYKLSRIDKELNELYSLRGDIPTVVQDLTNQKNTIDAELSSLQDKLDEILAAQHDIISENQKLIKRIEKNDNLLRSGAVKSNDEYNALAREIEDAYEKIDSNENLLEQEYKGKTTDLENKIIETKTNLDEVTAALAENQTELDELNQQTEDEEKELKKKRNQLIPSITSEDIEFYNRVNDSKFGDAIAIVRKGSCLGCFSSIPPQRSIEIRMVNRFFHCEACGRILIAEEIIAENAG